MRFLFCFFIIFALFLFLFPQTKILAQGKITQEKRPIIGLEELIKIIEKIIFEIQKEISQERREKAENCQGIYLDGFAFQTKKEKIVRKKVLNYLDQKKINCVVIDVKENQGPLLKDSLKDFIKELHQKDAYVIARIVVFRDSSLINSFPQYYLKTKKGTPFKDNKGNYWLDPNSLDVLNYTIEFSKKVIDFGFDELQFDYLRFPSEGDVENIFFPFPLNKREIIFNFSKELVKELKNYKKDIILSLDVFGYLAVQFKSDEIGQTVDDFLDFDFLSFMLYPSHFYKGFQVKEDKERNLPFVYFPYDSLNIKEVVSNHPYEVVYRSLLSINDYLKNFEIQPQRVPKVRPWLQAFNLKNDTQRGIFYNKNFIELQIKATEDASSSGYLLWNPDINYSFLEK